MDSKIQLNEDYKFKFSNMLNFFLKDMISESGKEEDKELNNKIEKIKREQDNVYINGLEKNIETHEIIKKRKTTKNPMKNEKNDNVIEKNINLINKEKTLEEEKDR